MVQTEKEEKNKEEKYVRALKEGEKALEEKTLLLARTRNEIQTQMTEFHELNSKINKMRAELKEVQANIRKGKNEVVILSEKREEERRTRELDVKVCFNVCPIKLYSILNKRKMRFLQIKKFVGTFF